MVVELQFETCLWLAVTCNLTADGSGLHESKRLNRENGKGDQKKGSQDAKHFICVLAETSGSIFKKEDNCCKSSRKIKIDQLT